MGEKERKLKLKSSSHSHSLFSIHHFFLYSTFTLAKKYLKYYLTAGSGKGHGVHSPFVFDFIKNVLNDRTEYGCYKEIEAVRERLIKDKTTIEVEDFGAGSSVIKTNKRVVGTIAASSLKPKKFAQLIYRIAAYYKPQNITELGTSLGITTAYLAKANESAKVCSLEGSAAIAKIAQQNFSSLGIKNIQLLQGDFVKTLPALLAGDQQTDLVFIDGNHRKEPTLQYFEAFLKNASVNTVFIFDDIHWSSGMEAAWDIIKSHEAVTLTIDLFFIGLVFLRHDFKVKQHFSIRF